MGDENTRSGGIQVIARSAEILRILRTASAGLTQAEVGERVGLARSTVHRLLSALQEEGLVESTGRRGRYRLGPEISRMAEAAWRGTLDDVHPLLEELSSEVGETADLSVLDHASVTLVDQVVAPRRLRAVSAIGESFPLHCTANGKAFLASFEPAALATLLPASLDRLTPNTITDPALLHRELDRVRESGIAYDRQEHTAGICAVGAVLGPVTGVCLAVSIPLPVQRFYGRQDVLAGALRGWLARVQTALSA
jgi:DNA-binding IclR family transcriptional regulator